MTSIYTKDLGSLLRNNPQAKILSLDCFDTLLWRSVQKPKDIFSIMEEDSLFKDYRITSETRIAAERQCRKSAIQNGLHEIKISEIYKEILQTDDEGIVSQFVNAELDQEKKYCYIYEPMLDILEQAKALKLKTWIVSDIYFSADELKILVENSIEKAGRKSPIDFYFTSADFRKMKSHGLLLDIANKFEVPTSKILHFGDNYGSDYKASIKVGAKAYHFKKYSATIEEIDRLNQIAGSVLLGKSYLQSCIANNYSQHWAKINEPSDVTDLISQYVLGPLLINYVSFILHKSLQIIEMGRSPKVAFLMRDGYLVHEVFKKMVENKLTLNSIATSDLNISRIAALNASLKSAEAVQRYLSVVDTFQSSDEILKNLGFSFDEISNLKFSTKVDLHAWLLSETVVERIILMNENNRSGLYHYIENNLTPNPNDTILLVDIGLRGTIQNIISPEITKRWGARVEGIYLVLGDSSHSNTNKFGYFSSHEFDTQTIEVIQSQIQLIECFTCNDQPSVSGYSSLGEPIYGVSTVNQKQKDTKLLVQKKIMHFVQNFTKGNINFILPNDMSRAESLAIIGRYLFFPQPAEIKLFSEFSHDINIGTSRNRILADPLGSKKSLQESGLIFSNFNGVKGRHYGQNFFGIERAIFDLSKNRFALDLRPTDFARQNNEIDSFIGLDKQLVPQTVRPFSTHDGHQTIFIRLQNNVKMMGFVFGKKFQWLHCMHVSIFHHQTLPNITAWSEVGVDLMKFLNVTDGEMIADNVYKFNNKAGILAVSLSQIQLPDLNLSDFILAINYIGIE